MAYKNLDNKVCKSDLLGKRVVFIVTLPMLQKSNLGMQEMKTEKDVTGFWDDLLEGPSEEDIELALPDMVNPIWQNLVKSHDIQVWVRKFSDGSFIEFVVC